MTENTAQDIPATTAGPADDQTTVMADRAATQLGWLAWSDTEDYPDDDPADDPDPSWPAALARAARPLFAAAAVAFVVAAGYALLETQSAPPVPAAECSTGSTSEPCSASKISTPSPASTVTVVAPPPPPTTITVQAAAPDPPLQDPDVVRPPVDDPRADQLFIQKVLDAGMVIHDNRLAVVAAKAECGQLDQGETYGQLAAYAASHSSPPLSPEETRAYLSAVTETYCPRWAVN
jgi:hypothetical protein